MSEIFQSDAVEKRMLILAPVGNDAAVTSRILGEAGIVSQPCNNTEELVREIDVGCAGLILAEEALGPKSLGLLANRLCEQPSWSGIPILVITGKGEPTEVVQRKLATFGREGNVSLLERPFRPLTIVNAAQVALRARDRQYQVRDLLVERDRILTNLERNVEMRTRELRETNEQLEEFVYSIAHDLRAPLRSMQGFSSLLLEQYGSVLPDEGRSYSERIVRSAEAMDAITLDLLAYGRMARSEVVLGPVSVEAAWKSAVFQCERAIQESKAVIATGEHLPLVHAQGSILTQVLANLLSNALKFMRDGETPRIVFRAEEMGGKVRLWLEDNGIGIPPEYKERIFRVFERLHGGRYHGTGIGLSIVRKGLERMGGTVGVESELGRGSRFWIDLHAAERAF